MSGPFRQEKQSEKTAKSCLVLACSPRPGGNCDTAAKLFARVFSRTPEEEPEGLLPHFLRNHAVEPCIACGACERMAAFLAGRGASVDAASLYHGPDRDNGRFLPYGCPLTARDDSADLLHALATAPALCLVAPIYFYHLPARLKGLLDRTQTFWSLREAGVDAFAGQEPRVCHVILLGARPKGDQLFAGSLLTLKYALGGLHIRLAEPLLLHGLDEPDALANDAGACERVRAYAEEAAARFSRDGSASCPPGTRP